MNRPKRVVVTILFLLSTIAGCTSSQTFRRQSSPLAFVMWDSNFALVVNYQRERAAEALGAKVISDKEWEVPNVPGQSRHLEVLAIDQIPAEFTATCLSSAEPSTNMKCVVTQPAREECQNLGDSSAYIWYRPVRKCEPGDLTDKCTPLDNKPIAHFDLYRTPDCSGTAVRRQVVVPGESCQ